MARLLVLLFVCLLISACGPDLPTEEELWQPPVTAEPTEQAEPTSIPIADENATPTEVAPTAIAATVYTVQRGTVEQMLSLEGQVVAQQQRSVMFANGGLIQAVHVEVGDTVEPKQLLAELDPGDLITQLQEAQKAYDMSKRTLDRATQQQEIAVRRAQLDLEAAQAHLSQLQAPPSQIEISKAQAHVTQAQARLDRTRNDASERKNQAEQVLRQAQRAQQEAQWALAAAQERERQLTKKSSPEERAAVQAQIAEAQEALRKLDAEVATAQIAYDTAFNNEIAEIKSAEADLALAQAELDALLNGPNPRDLAEANNAVKKAALAVDEARVNLSPSPDLIQQVNNAAQQIADIEAQIEQMRLYANFSGTVTAVNVQVGDIVQAGQPVFVILDSSIDPQALQIETTFTNEPAAAKLRVGSPVTVTFPNAGDKIVKGEIAQVISNQDANAVPLDIVGADVRYIVRFDASKLDVEAGDAAVVDLVLARRENTLWLPAEAVRVDGSVLVQRGERQELISVQVGIIGANRVEILGGLQEGDSVLVN
jgi:HlyD family secretion protein